MVHVDRFDHQIYTPEQVSQFLDCIALPAKYRSSPVLEDKNAANTAEGLAFATVLQKYFLANVPWENLDLHYSPHHTVNLDPMHLFHKIVERGMDEAATAWRTRRFSAPCWRVWATTS
jgi:hypothetical protein